MQIALQQAQLCELCGKPFADHSLDLLQSMRDAGVFRFDFCPHCGGRTDDKAEHLEWQQTVIKYVKEQRQ